MFAAQSWTWGSAWLCATKRSSSDKPAEKEWCSASRSCWTWRNLASSPAHRRRWAPSCRHAFCSDLHVKRELCWCFGNKNLFRTSELFHVYITYLFIGWTWLYTISNESALFPHAKHHRVSNTKPHDTNFFMDLNLHPLTVSN